jgi:phosphoglucomutase
MEDYLKGIGDIPSDNVLRFLLEDGSWVAARPSGTEPKLKVYYSVRGQTRGEAEETLEKLKLAVHTLLADK